MEGPEGRLSGDNGSQRWHPGSSAVCSRDRTALLGGISLVPSVLGPCYTRASLHVPDGAATWWERGFSLLEASVSSCHPTGQSVVVFLRGEGVSLSLGSYSFI